MYFEGFYNLLSCLCTSPVWLPEPDGAGHWAEFFDILPSV